MLSRRGFLSVLCCLTSFIACGCSSGTSVPTASESGTQRPQGTVVTAEKIPIKLALNWFPEAEHGGYYAALVHGEFAKEGLDVTILPGGPKAPVIPQVASGGPFFGVDNADKLLLGRAQEADVIAVFAPIQTSPRCILVHEESGITSFDDLAAAKNFTLAMNPGQPFAQFLNHKYPMEGVQKVPYPGNLSQFLLDKQFGQQAYSFSEPFVAQQGGAKTRNLMLADIGFNSYTSLLVVSRELFKDQPQIVQAMVRASARGWERYLNDPAETNAYIHQQNPEMSPEILAFGANDLRALCKMPDGAPFGSMTEARWSALIQDMSAAGSLPGVTLDPQASFTNGALSVTTAETLAPVK